MLQKNDEWCNKIRNDINNQTRFQLLDDVLYKRNNKEAADYFVLCTPECMTKFVLKMCHDEHRHFGRDKTLESVKSRFYWPSMYSDVKVYVQSCVQCQQGRVERKPTYGVLQSIEYPTKPFEHLNADILGPLAHTSSGKTYIIIARFINGSRLYNERSCIEKPSYLYSNRGMTAFQYIEIFSIYTNNLLTY